MEGTSLVERAACPLMKWASCPLYVPLAHKCVSPTVECDTGVFRKFTMRMKACFKFLKKCVDTIEIMRNA